MTHIRSVLKKNLYELWKCRLPNMSYFHTFGCKLFVHKNVKEALEKCGAKSDKGIFLGYLSISKVYAVFNKRLENVEESIYVIFDETNHFSFRIVDDDVGAKSKFKNLNLNGKDDQKMNNQKNFQRSRDMLETIPKS